MTFRTTATALCLALGMVSLGVSRSHAEIVEEIVAWVNGDIITKSEVDLAEQEMIAEAYRRFTGEELDRQVNETRTRLLQDLIDRKLLVDRAGRLFDLEIMGENLVDHVMETQQVEDDEQFERLLAQEGLTREEFQNRLVDSVAPEEVIRLEVGARVAVGDKAVQAYYEEHLDEFTVPAEVTLREIVLLTQNNTTGRRKEARKVWQEATAEGADFAAVAEKYSDVGTKDNGGLLGPLPMADLSTQLAEVATNTPIGQVSDLLEMPYGFHIIMVENRTDPHTKPLAEVRETIRAYLENDDYNERLQAFLRKLRDEAEIEVNKKYVHRLEAAWK